jgi:tetratricopeptide (TPR) repeat protein
VSAPGVPQDWQVRVDRLWADVDAGTLDGPELVARADALAEERPADDAAALFERACARDTAGLEAEAEQFYRRALATGALDPYRQARASLQLGSTLRILGRLAESAELIEAQLARYADPSHDRALFDETRAILALTRHAQGRPSEAAALALLALAPHLSRYRRSVAGNAEEILAGTPAG